MPKFYAAHFYFDKHIYIYIFISGPLQVGHMQRLLDINIVPGQFKDEPVPRDPASNETQEGRDEEAWLG